MSPAKKTLIHNGTPPPPSTADWQANLRQALMEAVTPDDMREIASGLVERAKKGEKAAVDLLFRYVLGDPKITVRNAVITGAPTGARPGTPDKLKVMELRAARGLPLSANGDAPMGGSDLS